MPIGVRPIAVAILCLGAVSLSAQPDSVHVTLSGHVYDEAGNPVSGAQIDLLPLEAAWSGPRPFVGTDEHGYFHAVVPALGKTRVSASKISAGYPDTTWKLCSSENDSAVVVELTGDQPVSDVNVHLGPPDGIIRGMVINKTDGSVVRSARILMRWADDTSVMYSGNVPSSGIFQYALPQHPILLTITAGGFKPWTYIDQDTKEKFVKIGPGNHLLIQIELEPVENH